MTEEAITYCREHDIEPSKVPVHIAIIMDGNGRWAMSRNMPRHQGHIEGVNTVRRITEECSRLGVEYLTLYTFSTENWNRPQEEVDGLMELIAIAIERETPDLIKNNVRLTMIGDLDRLPSDPRRRLERCIESTSHCSGLTLCLAISYSARWEIVNAVRTLAGKVADGTLKADEIAEADFEASLTTAAMPDPDLLIRTGGDYRISNYLLWQIAYAELSFTDVYWPDFNDEQLREIIRHYGSRQRRYGLTGEQVEHNKTIK